MNSKIYGVQPTSDRLVYLVNSDEAGVKPWRVDLEQFDGWGACECPSFKMGRNGEPSKLERLRRGDRSMGVFCKHLQRAHWAHSIWLNQKILAAANKAQPRYRSEAERNDA